MIAMTMAMRTAAVGQSMALSSDELPRATHAVAVHVMTGDATALGPLVPFIHSNDATCSWVTPSMSLAVTANS